MDKLKMEMILLQTRGHLDQVRNIFGANEEFAPDPYAEKLLQPVVKYQEITDVLDGTVFFKVILWCNCLECYFSCCLMYEKSVRLVGPYFIEQRPLCDETPLLSLYTNPFLSKEPLS